MAEAAALTPVAEATLAEKAAVEKKAAEVDRALDSPPALGVVMGAELVELWDAFDDLTTLLEKYTADFPWAQAAFDMADSGQATVELLLRRTKAEEDSERVAETNGGAK